MKYDKRIVTVKLDTDELFYSQGIVMSVDSYRHDIAFLNELVAAAKRDFLDLEDKDIEVFVVTKSEYNLGFWGVIFRLPPGTNKNGYSLVDNIDFCYKG